MIKWALILLSYRLVYSSALEWVPQGDQESDFADAPCKPANDNILLAKLRPGQARAALVLPGLVTEYIYSVGNIIDITRYQEQWDGPC